MSLFPERVLVFQHNYDEKVTTVQGIVVIIFTKHIHIWKDIFRQTTTQEVNDVELF